MGMKNIRNMRHLSNMETAGTAEAHELAGTPVTNATAEAHDETAQEVSICARIRNLRAYLGLSQAAFSKPLNLSPTHIARLEK